MASAVQDAIGKYGVHSAGSAALLGNSFLSHELEGYLSHKLKMKHVMLFPTGWAAGFGVIAGLVRSRDILIMDKLSHACLLSGATQTGAKVLRFDHNSIESLEGCLKKACQLAPDAGILVVTESLFSMDSDSPCLASIKKMCEAYEATLLVDVAHCFGNCGPNGTGVLGTQNMLGKIDLVIGSFSKTFASNGGFVATNNPGVKHFLQWFSSPWTFSNGPTPLQCAVVMNALRIIDSAEGELLRERLASAVHILRTGLENHGLPPLGTPSAIVPVVIGDSALLRTVSRLLPQYGVLANMTEFPVVARDKGRLRLQVMAAHEPADMERAAEIIGRAYRDAKQQLGL